MIADPGVPVRDLLLGPEAAELLDMVVSEVGGSCTSARPTQVRYLPGSSITVQYTAEVTWADDPGTTETMVAMSGIRTPIPTPVLEVDGTSISVWRYPNDPFLPGLGAAADPNSARGVLRKLGAPSDEVRLRRRAYRPGRRAVVEVSTAEARVFLKVVRPSRVARLQARHREMVGHVAVPHSHGWSEELGLVAIQAMPGVTLRKGIGSGPGAVPNGAHLIALLDELPELGNSAPTVGGPITRVANHVRLLSNVAPSLGGRIESLARGLRAEEQPVTTVHGDFHTSQVITAEGAVVGLIDVDTAGRGSRADDLATMLAQVSTLSLGPNGTPFRRYGQGLIEEFDRLVDPVDLRHRTAAAVLGFATGPFRVQEADWEKETGRRVELAGRWLESAEKPHR